MNLSIRNKLLVGFSIILLLILIMAYFATSKFSESNERLLNIVDVSAQKVSISNELMIAMLDVTRHEKNHLLVKDAEQKQLYKSLIDLALEKIDSRTKALEKLVDGEAKVILLEFKATLDSLEPYHEEIIKLSNANETEAATQFTTGGGRKSRESALEMLDQIIELNEAKMQSDKGQNVASYNAALNLIIALIVITFFIALAISYWIIQSIGKRIATVTKEAERIASREFSYSQMDDPIKDEVKPVFDALKSINESFTEVTENANRVASGDYTRDFKPRSDNDLLGNSLKKMTISLRETTAANQKHNWLTTGQNQLNQKLIGDLSLEQLAANTISFFCNYLHASIGSVYLINEASNELKLGGQYAFLSHKEIKERFAIQEGLIGQAAKEQKQISLRGIGEEHVRITSSVLDAKPRHLLITPFLFEGKTLGVIEIGTLTEFSETEIEFINSSMGGIAISVNSAMARRKIQELLEETQMQSEELQSQQEELKQMNEELEEQTQSLKQQQEELQMTNEELEEQTQALEMKNTEVLEAKFDIEQKTKQLEISSKYKSEFLANMSHELRTPLNSLLILSKDLADNRRKNLDNEQVESAEIIYKSGHDLLKLINEVLDLSKIEAGKMSVNIEKVELQHFLDDQMRGFRHHAEQKGLRFTLNIDSNLPQYIQTDPQRLSQILKNLLSNAIKFTEKGGVKINVARHEESKINVTVADTGIGISEDKQMVIFEAFQQADGGTSRKYGGTGLGLSISRELAKILGAEIKLSSTVDKGSAFSVILPFDLEQQSDNLINKSSLWDQAPTRVNDLSESKYLNYPSIEDDRAALMQDDKIVLIIEDDLKFASILLNQAHQNGFKCLVASTGEDGLLLATKHRPHAIILDIDLPGINGHMVLNELKANPALRHIPVHVMSVDERSLNIIKEGAIDYLMKPVNKQDLDQAFGRIEGFISRKMKNLLIVEDDENSRKAIRKLIGNGDVKCFEAGSGKESLKIYTENHIDCIVLDLGLPDLSGFELIQEFGKIEKYEIPPIIIYTGKELSKEENKELQKYSETIIIKGVKSEERLLDETALFLHRTISNLPESKQAIINHLYDKELLFHGKKIVIADDDMRNVFSLSKILKERGMEIIKADNGKIALEMLNQHPDTDMVLMDIMMPEMDGYEAMQSIRTQSRFRKLPIIALTAKAMKDDRQKCIDAGANDYIAKPVDIDRLLSLMRVWLSK